MIQLESICRNFQLGDQEVHALTDIFLEIDEGEYISVMGPSGSGKSTLLHLIGLLDHPTAGRYRMSGQDVTELTDDQLARIRRENIGFVFQFFHLIPRLTAAQNIEIPLILAGYPPTERKRRIAECVKAFGLADRAEHRPDQLSGGQRQRVAIARSTIMQPRVVLADEPTGNLDRASGRQVVELLEELHEKGVTVIVVTHDPALGDRATRRIHMVDGRISEDTQTEAH
ncbi:MAG: ABC transporter ATP-binding protein [Gammaproteobacteria bacterium]